MTTDHTDIDYAALATEVDFIGCHPSIREPIARAVVAAYQDQQRERGVVEVRADDLREAIAAINGDSTMPWAVLDRLEALAAPDDAPVVLD